MIFIFVYVLPAALVLYFVAMLVKKRRSGAGESGIILVPLLVPWILIPVISPVITAILAVPLNAFILYCLFGGLKTDE